MGGSRTGWLFTVADANKFFFSRCWLPTSLVGGSSVGTYPLRGSGGRLNLVCAEWAIR